MATYEEIYGKRVKEFDSDPTLDSSYEGQVWYDKSSGVLKSVVSFDTWFSSTNLSEARRVGGGFGTNSASITFGGFGPPDNKTTTEEYNGSGWTAGGALNNGTARFSGSVGTLTAGLTAGGLSTPTVYQNSAEEYNGTSWTSVTNLPAARGVGSVGGIGTQTAAIIAVGGSGIPTSVDAATLKYDGTNWTSGGSMNTGRTYTAGFGTQTAGIYMAGGPGTKANVESYDGTSWSETTDVSVGRRRLVTSNNSPQTSGIGASGYAAPGRTNSTESWNGTSWTTRSNMGTTRDSATGAGTSSNSMMVSGGDTGSASTAVEEFTSSINTITAAAWASGGNMNTARRGISSAKNATQDAALGAMGYTGANTGVNNAEEYDGSSWTNVSTVPTSRYFGGGFGIQTAGVVYGGYRSPSQQNATDEWDGSSWSTGGTLPSAQSNFAADGCGILTAGLSSFGIPGPAPSTIHYDGSSWTAVPGTLNTSRTSGSSFGTQTAAIAATGNVPGSPGNTLASESYNGTAWTATSNAIYGGYGNGCGGTQTAGFIGGTYPNGTTSQGWDGSTWFTTPSISTGRSESGGAGTSTAGIIFAGSTTNPTTYTAATEEFTGETETIASKTLTTS